MNVNRNFDHISPILLRMRYVAELQRKWKHAFCVQLLFVENRAVYEIMSKNIVEPGRPQMTIWRKRIACWIHNATNTHSEYVIVIAFLLQQRLHLHTCLLCINYTSELPNAYVYDRRKRWNANERGTNLGVIVLWMLPILWNILYYKCLDSSRRRSRRYDVLIQQQCLSLLLSSSNRKWHGFVGRVGPLTSRDAICPLRSSSASNF